MAQLPSTMDMDVDDFIRGRSTSLSKMRSRSISVVSNASSIPYYLRIEINSNLLDKNIVELIDSSQLSYQDDVKRGDNSVSKAADISPTRNSQCVQYEALALNKASKSQGKSATINNTNASPP